MGLFDGYQRAVEELRDSDDHNPKPRSRSPTQRGSGLFRSIGPNREYQRHEPPEEEMAEYWEAYERTPFIRQSINSFAREVTEPGWFIESENEQAAEDVAEWFRNCAIVERQPGQDFTLLARKAIIQREVRGTGFVEHVPDRDDKDALAGLKLINAESTTVFTNSDTSMLVQPDDTDVPEDIPLLESGEPAAFAQFYWEGSGGQETVLFTEDQVTQLSRDADVGEVFGTSRLAAILDRLKSLRQKREDLDQAIENKAWPVWIFKFGSEDNPWHPDDIDAFMDGENEDNYSPGTKHGVQGDINVDTVGGDVPDISGEIQEDIRYILSIMPMPKFATGYADSDLSKHTAQQMDAHIKRQVREARRELEYEFQDVVDVIAEQTGHSDVDDLSIRFERPPDEEDPEKWEDRGTTIRYVSDAEKKAAEEDGEENDGEGSDGESGSGSTSSGESDGSDGSDENGGNGESDDPPDN